MGVDFINKVKLRWRKGWSREREKFSIRQLFASEPSRAQMIEVVPFKVSDFKEGEPYEVQLESERLFIYKKGKSIGVCKAPSRDILQKVQALGGKTLGAVRTKGSGERIEVAVLLTGEVGKGRGPNEHVSRSAPALPQR
jgi:hypothetical protein